tara:strand:+ start:285 stop:644 length:360 start_codon:yes stop_codon:yes gene_type:complete
MKKNMINTVFPNANKNNGIVFSEEKLNSKPRKKYLGFNIRGKNPKLQLINEAQYKILIFYDLLAVWYKDKELAKLDDYEDIFSYTKKVMDEYDKSEFAVDYTQSELACIKEFFIEKFGR